MLEDLLPVKSWRESWTPRASILLTVFTLFASLSIIQFVVALYANSFMLLCDSCVMFVDCVTFKVNLNAELGWSENTKRDQLHASGFSIAALLLLTTITSVLTAFRIHRNFTKNHVNSNAMLGFGLIGLAFDVVSFFTFHCMFTEEGGEDSQQLNMSSAWLHVLSDTLRSVSTIAVAIFMTEDTQLNGREDVELDSYAALCANALVFLSAIPALCEWYSQNKALAEGDYMSLVTEEDEQQLE